MPGSVRRQTSSSSVPIEKAALTTSPGGCDQQIEVAEISVPFVRIENGLR